MTGRELIRRIVDSIENFDDPISVEVLYRDEHDYVVQVTETKAFYFVLGKIKVEGDSLKEK